ncbi:MAG TPA: hypothetical protein VMY43_10890, partial [Methanothrix sp.]|nr:hypothetical protein [Methanothrix sp.]
RLNCDNILISKAISRVSYRSSPGTAAGHPAGRWPHPSSVPWPEPTGVLLGLREVARPLVAERQGYAGVASGRAQDRDIAACRRKVST